MKLNKEEIGRRYARALFEYAGEERQYEPILEELLQLEQVYQQIPDLKNIFSDARLSVLKKQKLVDLMQQNVSPIMQRFLQLLFDYQRLDILPEVVTAYQQRFDQMTKTYHAVITSAVDLDDQQVTRLQAALATRLGANQVLVETKVDPEIVGGIITQIGDQIVDGSIRTRLQHLNQVLLNN